MESRLSDMRPPSKTTTARDLLLEGARFGSVGVWATAVYLAAAVVAVVPALSWTSSRLWAFK